MTIIELLNKIANGEEVPHFEYDDIECYLGADGYLKDQYGDNVEWWIDKNWLNEKVEILEEENKIEKMPYYDYSEIMSSEDNLKTMELMIEKHEKRINDNWEKINEIIDEINKLKEKQ